MAYAGGINNLISNIGKKFGKSMRDKRSQHHIPGWTGV